MPKETFLNLDPEKRERFLQAAILEFAENNFDTASINRIVRSLNIARGSVYQYFEDKLDLWLYLKAYAETCKMRYIQSVVRSDYADFWEYYRALFVRGIDFDLEEPLCSRFLYRVSKYESSAEVVPYLNDWQKKARVVFCEWVSMEQEAGSFDPELPVDITAHYMMTVSISIADLLQDKYQVDFEGNLRAGKPLFGGNRQELTAAVEELVNLLERSLKKQS